MIDERAQHIDSNHETPGLRRPHGAHDTAGKHAGDGGGGHAAMVALDWLGYAALGCSVLFLALLLGTPILLIFFGLLSEILGSWRSILGTVVFLLAGTAVGWLMVNWSSL